MQSDTWGAWSSGPTEGPEGEGQGEVWGMGTRLPASLCPVWRVTPSPTNQHDGSNRLVDPRIPEGNIFKY